MFSFVKNTLIPIFILSFFFYKDLNVAAKSEFTKDRVRSELNLSQEGKFYTKNVCASVTNSMSVHVNLFNLVRTHLGRV